MYTSVCLSDPAFLPSAKQAEKGRRFFAKASAAVKRTMTDTDAWNVERGKFWKVKKWDWIKLR